MNNSYSYNDNGEQTERIIGSTGYALSYDGDGQMLAITTGSGMSLTTIASFTYDVGQRRASRASGGTTTDFLCDGTNIVNAGESARTGKTVVPG